MSSKMEGATTKGLKPAAATNNLTSSLTSNNRSENGVVDLSYNNSHHDIMMDEESDPVAFCDNCNHNFDEHVNPPIQSMACGHSICAGCLDAIVRQERRHCYTGSYKNTRGGHLVDCHNCLAPNAFHTRKRHTNILACASICLIRRREKYWNDTLQAWHKRVNDLEAQVQGYQHSQQPQPQPQQNNGQHSGQRASQRQAQEEEEEEGTSSNKDETASAVDTTAAVVVVSNCTLSSESDMNPPMRPAAASTAAASAVTDENTKTSTVTAAKKAPPPPPSQTPKGEELEQKKAAVEQSKQPTRSADNRKKSPDAPTGSTGDTSASSRTDEVNEDDLTTTSKNHRLVWVRRNGHEPRKAYLIQQHGKNVGIEWEDTREYGVVRLRCIVELSAEASSSVTPAMATATSKNSNNTATKGKQGGSNTTPKANMSHKALAQLAAAASQPSRKRPPPTLPLTDSPLLALEAAVANKIAKTFADTKQNAAAEKSHDTVISPPSPRRTRSRPSTPSPAETEIETETADPPLKHYNTATTPPKRVRGRPRKAESDGLSQQPQQGIKGKTQKPHKNPPSENKAASAKHAPHQLGDFIESPPTRHLRNRQPTPRPPGSDTSDDDSQDSFPLTVFVVKPAKPQLGIKPAKSPGASTSPSDEEEVKEIEQPPRRRGPGGPGNLAVDPRPLNSPPGRRGGNQRTPRPQHASMVVSPSPRPTRK